MMDTCLDAGLEKPVLEEIGTHFRVTFFTEKKRTKHIAQLDEVDKAILLSLKQSEGLSTQQIADEIGRSSRSTRSRLIVLVSRGLVVDMGSSPQDPKRKYYLAEKT